MREAVEKSAARHSLPWKYNSPFLESPTCQALGGWANVECALLEVECGELHVQIARTLHVHGTKMNCTHILHEPILGSDGRPVGGALAHHVSSAHPQKRPLVSSAIGRILCCVRSILTNDGVSSSDGSMPIDFGGGTMQIGRLLVEISRFLFLKIFVLDLDACGWCWTYLVLCSLDFNKRWRFRQRWVHANRHG